MPDGWEVVDRFNRSATAADWYYSGGTSYTIINGIVTTARSGWTLPTYGWTSLSTTTALHHYWGESVDLYALRAQEVANRVDRERAQEVANRVDREITQVILDGRRAPDPERDARRNRERAARDVARTQARDRADELLLMMLSPEQRESYRQTREFELIGSAGGRYRIRRGSSGNVDWLDPNGHVAGVLCAHPEMDEDWLPDQDVAIAQLLALTTDEPSFIRVANVHAGRRPVMPRRELNFAVRVA